MMKNTITILDSSPCQVRQMIPAVFFLITSCAFATISIQVPNKVIKYGNTDIDILCAVNGTSLQSTDGIQLKRSNTSIVSISNYGIGWQDKILQTRSKINANIENVNRSYLHLKILACNVERTDEATYYCDLSATKEDFSQYPMSSEQISLNITGFVDRKTDKCGQSSHATFAKGSGFVLMQIAIVIAVLD